MKKVGIIGAGNIGCAIAKGLVSYKKMNPSDILVSRKKSSLLSDLQASGFTVSDNKNLVSKCDIIILAVLPGQAKGVVQDLKSGLKDENKILVSVVAAVSIEEIAEWSDNGIPVIRIMPNTAVEYGASMTCIAGQNEDAIAMVEELFTPLGQTMVIKEQLMPAATILAACGIAFFLRFIRAVSQGG
ncbi:MAG: NAD(P)-binding domain-containing protein, partial [Bacteroidales bacterium]|nr:NAD(P)-binding domain-containing protein [Bacteroidales bacterium]